MTTTPILTSGFPLGSSAGLVAAFAWLGQPYRLTRVDMLGEMRDASYARINARHDTDTGWQLAQNPPAPERPGGR